MATQAIRVPMAGPGDISGVKALLENGTIRAEEVIAILAKTEGNGCVNDFTRGYSTFAFQTLLAEALEISREEASQRVAFVMSGGTEGVLSPHAMVFTRSKNGSGAKAREKRLTIGIARTRDFLPEEIGRMSQVREVARAVAEALHDAEIQEASDVHFVQIKCPLLTSERIDDAHRRGYTTATADTYESMGYSRGASALGIGLALGEIDEAKVSDEVICKDWSFYSKVASTSAGVELLNCEIILFGNSIHSASDFTVGHSVMKDAIDREAVYEALKSVDIDPDRKDRSELSRIVNVFAKAEADSRGYVRERRHTMLNDSDINSTRHARAVVGGVIASIVGDPMVYVSGGAEHQGPIGGGPIAVIATASRN